MGGKYNIDSNNEYIKIKRGKNKKCIGLNTTLHVFKVQHSDN